MMNPKLHGAVRRGLLGITGGCWSKKCGAESSDPNRHSQPRLPGSVVGEASMRQRAAGGKITKVSVQVITSAEAVSEEL